MSPELLHQWTDRLSKNMKHAVNLSHSSSETAAGIGTAAGHASALMFVLYRQKLLSIEGPREFRGGALEYVRETIGIIEQFLAVPLDRGQ